MHVTKYIEKGKQKSKKYIYTLSNKKKCIYWYTHSENIITNLIHVQYNIQYIVLYYRGMLHEY
jgi:hypothetical protein